MIYRHETILGRTETTVSDCRRKFENYGSRMGWSESHFSQPYGHLIGKDAVTTSFVVPLIGALGLAGAEATITAGFCGFALEQLYTYGWLERL
jgi:hypothetical protein